MARSSPPAKNCEVCDKLIVVYLLQESNNQSGAWVWFNKQVYYSNTKFKFMNSGQSLLNLAAKDTFPGQRKF